jgi:N-acetylmuramoyl-L-alanine amidase
MPPETGRRRAALARLALAISCLAPLAACESGLLMRSPPPVEPAPVIDRAAASAQLVTGYLESLQRLLQSAPAEQAEAVAAAQREYDLAPTPSHQLRLALILATPGHSGTDQPRAQRLLRELMAAPVALMPAERALAFLEQQKLDAQLALTAENKRLQSSVVRNDRDRNAAQSKRLQAEIEENARLRKRLEEAQAKLDAISDIEKSLNERKPSAESRNP